MSSLASRANIDAASGYVATPEDETLDASKAVVIEPRPHVSARLSPSPNMELVEGDSGASQESMNLFRARLRVAAPALGFGFTLFAIWIWIRELATSNAYLDLQVLILHTTITIGLLAIGLLLASKRPLSVATLRWCETLIFGMPAIFFSILHYYEIVFIAQNFSLIVTMPLAGWLILIFAYAFFVPNSWRRVLAVVVTMSLLPIVSTCVAMWRHIDVRVSIQQDPSGFGVIGCRFRCRDRSADDYTVTKSGCGSQAVGPLSLEGEDRQWWHGRCLSGRTHADETPLCH